MRFARIENGIVTNILSASKDFAEAAGLICVRDDAKIGMTVETATAPDPETLSVDRRVQDLESRVDELMSAIERGLSL